MSTCVIRRLYNSEFKGRLHNEMDEKVELRIYKKYAHLLLQLNEGKDLGLYVAVDIPTNDPRFDKARLLTEEIRKKYNDFFFLIR